MKVFRSVASLNEHINSSCVATIGNFDGVHEGHQHLISKICDDSNSESKVIVITFNPHPDILIKDRKNFLINTPGQKYEQLGKCGVDYILEIEFNDELRNLNPTVFFEKFIVGIKNLERFFMGEDFSLGKDKCFSIKNAEKILDKNKIASEVIYKKLDDNFEISSTFIREYIQKADFEKAESLLGRKFSFISEIARGYQLGRSIEFKTANIIFDQKQLYPSMGVYAVKVSVFDKDYIGAMNIGINPTVSKNEDLKIETHIFNFDSEIYGETIRITPYQKIRDERKFDSLQDLKKQIGKDVEQIKEFFK